MLMCDVDYFKRINDTHGHPSGDAVLKEVARRLSRVGREADTVARLGGDEFAVIMEPPADQAAAKAVAKRILDMLAAPISFEGNLFIVGATIGIALSPAGAFDVADLLRRADNIMYKAKEDGRGIYRVAANSALPPVA